MRWRLTEKIVDKIVDKIKKIEWYILMANNFFVKEDKEDKNEI
jgi:hypothetical protein